MAPSWIWVRDGQGQGGEAFWMKGGKGALAGGAVAGIKWVQNVPFHQPRDC